MVAQGSECVSRAARQASHFRQVCYQRIDAHSDTFVKDPSAVVKPQQKVMVTVTEVDLARGRIALSMRSKPEIGPRSAPAGGGVPSPRPGPGQKRSPGAPPPPSASRPPASLNGDWFSAALNKKK